MFNFDGFSTKPLEVAIRLAGLFVLMHVDDFFIGSCMFLGGRKPLFFLSKIPEELCPSFFTGFSIDYFFKVRFLPLIFGDFSFECCGDSSKCWWQPTAVATLPFSFLNALSFFCFDYEIN